ncbi:MAG: LON peptidase substrate-binding domain-containing protein [Burkholderiaceae bacterium]
MPPLTLHSLPLFPLGAVLFPGGVLPLRVFEVRYLDMVSRCHRSGAPFGVVALASGHEVRAAGAPAERLESIGTLARIRAWQQPQAGLIHIECMGEQRFHIDRTELLPHGLWVADVSLLPPEPAVPLPDDLRHTAAALQRVWQGLRGASAAAGELADAAPSLDDCGWVANRWCELLPLPLALKQRLLGLDSGLLRLELVADWLERSGIDPAAR